MALCMKVPQAVTVDYVDLLGADFKVIHVGTQQIDGVAVEAFLSDGDIVDLAVAVVALVVETGAKHHASQGEQKYVCSHLSLSI